MDSGFHESLIVPEEDIWRNLPLEFPTEDRLRVEAITFATDILCLALSDLRQIARPLGKDATNITFEQRMRMFSHCWTIVDQMHAIRQMLNRMLDGEPGPEQALFLREYDVSRALRNKMDHLNGNIKNLSASGLQMPVHGVFSYFVPDLDYPLLECDPSVFVRGYAISVTSGSMVGSNLEVTGQWPGTEFISDEASHLVFSAFGLSLPLDAIIDDLRGQLDYIRLGHHRQIDEWMRSNQPHPAKRFHNHTFSVRLVWPVVNREPHLKRE